jgi:hypothetical protein
MIGGFQSVTNCDGYRIFRDGYRIFRDGHRISQIKHGISRVLTLTLLAFPFFCPNSVTAERKRKENIKKREKQIAHRNDE